jgi:hypothetical protein
MGPTEYCTTVLLPKPSQNLPRVSLWVQAFRIVGVLGCSPNVNSCWGRESDVLGFMAVTQLRERHTEWDTKTAAV